MTHDCTRIVLPSPIGPLRLDAAGDALTGMAFHAVGPVSETTVAGVLGEAARQLDAHFAGVLGEAARQLDAYFAGRLTVFDLPLAPRGTPFQLQVWQQLRQIPYGRTCSYADVAAAIGRPSATRAVGAANGRNPIPIVIPCHRVVGSTGALVGFGGGLDVKRRLLALERGRLPLD